MFCDHIAQIRFNDANGFILMKWIHLIVSQLCRPFFFCENSFTSHKCSSFLNLIKCLAQFIMVVGGFRFVIRCDVDNRCVFLWKDFLFFILAVLLVKVLSTTCHIVQVIFLTQTYEHFERCVDFHRWRSIELKSNAVTKSRSQFNGMA